MAGQAVLGGNPGRVWAVREKPSVCCGSHFHVCADAFPAQCLYRAKHAAEMNRHNASSPDVLCSACKHRARCRKSAEAHNAKCGKHEKTRGILACRYPSRTAASLSGTGVTNVPWKRMRPKHKGVQTMMVYSHSKCKAWRCRQSESLLLAQARIIESRPAHFLMADSSLPSVKGMSFS